MKYITTLLLSTLFLANSASGNNVATGISEFIYNMMYLNIGATPCQDVINRSRGQREKALVAQINQVINTSNSLIGKETLNRQSLEEYATNIYNYCEENPEKMVMHALLNSSKPIAKNATKGFQKPQASDNSANEAKKTDEQKNNHVSTTQSSNTNSRHNRALPHQYREKPSIEFID